MHNEVQLHNWLLHVRVLHGIKHATHIFASIAYSNNNKKNNYWKLHNLVLAKLNSCNSIFRRCCNQCQCRTCCSIPATNTRTTRPVRAVAVAVTYTVQATVYNRMRHWCWAVWPVVAAEARRQVAVLRAATPQRQSQATRSSAWGH